MSTLHKTLSGLSVRRAALLLLPVALAGAMIAVPPATAQTPTPVAVPTAALSEVNVPGTSPMSATAVDLAAVGYTAREFYAEGQANGYAGATAGALTTASVLDGGNPYRTRVMVRYPKADRFNGTLAVEWTNVTIGVDFEFAAAEASEYLLREGYAVAVVSAQRVGVERLKTWSPARYAGLSVDVNKCGDGGTSLCTGDPLSYDIFAQVTQALKGNVGGAAAPMPGLKVKDAIAIGQSQSAGRLAVYYNTVQPLHDVFEGFALWDRSGQLRSDLTVPAIGVASEGLGGSFGGARWTTSEYTRKWDIAGATHASLYGAEYIEAIAQRDQSIQAPDGQPITFFQWIEPACVKLPPFTTVDVGLVYNKAIDSVRTWSRTGKPAAPSRSFVTTDAGTVVRDADGKVEGGIRLPQFVVPTADQGALNGPAFPCNVSGWHRYYSDAELKAMYKTHAQYVSKVRKVMTPLVSEGYVLPADAAAAIRDAARSDVAR
ncbi:alpha/beta hydrolase domain-containing protein [Nocardioides sp. NBC_00163]|uniref:alpha/beta hydrolase domain-containing protein n=1 Tax=Nocardioides sp. NBC_00163 TaxID=2975999 RepID=UPI00324C0352